MKIASLLKSLSRVVSRSVRTSMPTIVPIKIDFGADVLQDGYLISVNENAFCLSLALQDNVAPEFELITETCTPK